LVDTYKQRPQRKLLEYIVGAGLERPESEDPTLEVRGSNTRANTKAQGARTGRRPPPYFARLDAQSGGGRRKTGKETIPLTKTKRGVHQGGEGPTLAQGGGGFLAKINGDKIITLKLPQDDAAIEQEAETITILKLGFTGEARSRKKVYKLFLEKIHKGGTKDTCREEKMALIHDKQSSSEEAKYKLVATCEGGGSPEDGAKGAHGGGGYGSSESCPRSHAPDSWQWGGGANGGPDRKKIVP